MKKLIFKNITLILTATTLLISCKKEDDKEDPTPKTSQVKVEFEHLFDGAAFGLGTTYTNGTGESVDFSMVKYYISNIELEMNDGTVWAEEESYHLIDLSDASSTILTLQEVPAGEYHKLSYMIGVDSVRNVSGAQEGALSPAHEMFWDWNTGYIFIKLEGNSPESGTGSFNYHVGGFSGSNNAITENAHHMHDHMLNVTPDATPQVHLKVDLKKVFDGDHHTISVAQLSNVHMPGSMAVMVAHNFGEAFELDHIHD